MSIGKPKIFAMSMTGMADIPKFSTFGARLRFWREKRGFARQGDLATALGISQPTLSELEKGHSKEPSASVLLKAADVLGLRAKYLLTGEGAAEAQYFQELNGLEAQLVMIFRQLPSDAMRDALLIDANNMLSRAQPGASTAANPYGHVPAPPPGFNPIRLDHGKKVMPAKTPKKA
jgi:transcriptional regulator with XRE-family HTH domain